MSKVLFDMMNSLINNTDTTDRRSAESNPKVSVILPVYNVEAYIVRCIESLKAQKLERLEFIFVDDCSTDGSMKAVETWAAEDKRVRILRNEENLGAGPSRNRGIEVASGEYLSFIDPDDWISDDFYAVLYTKAKETGADIVKGRREYVDKSGKPLDDWKKKNLNKRIAKSVRKKRPLYAVFSYEHQSAIYKALVIKQNRIRYGDSRKSEDVTFLFRVCKETQDIQIIDGAAYFYFRERSQSAVNDFSARRAEGDVEAFEERMSIILCDKLDKYAIQYIQKDFRAAITSLFYAYVKEPNTEKLIQIKQRLQTQINRIHDQESIKKDLPELSAFMDYDYVIPTSKTTVSDDLFSDRVESWVDFLTTQPDAIKPYAILGCASAFAYSMLIYVKTRLTGKSRNTKKLLASRQIVKEQWQRLDKRIRRKVAIHLPQAMAGTFFKKITNR